METTTATVIQVSFGRALSFEELSSLLPLPAAKPMTLRERASALRAACAHLPGVIVRVGKGCRTGALHVYMASGSTREQRAAASAFLRSVGAVTLPGRLCEDSPHFFDSATVLSWAVAS